MRRANIGEVGTGLEHVLFMPIKPYPEYIISFLVHGLAHDPSSPDIEDHENVKAFGPIYWYLI